MKRILCVMLILVLSISTVFAFDMNDPDDLRNMLDGFADKIVMAIPTEVSIDNMWADAYIGKLISIPPHLAVGANFGSAFMKDNSLLSSLSDLTGISQLSMFPGAPIPALSVNGRIGGIILPFDIGFHGMAVDIGAPLGSIDARLSINTWGVDFRYALLTQKLIIPAISIGIGYDQVDTKAILSLEETNTSTEIDCGFSVNTHLLSGTAEVSWNLLFLKLFAGARAIQPLDPITAKATISVNDTPYGDGICRTYDAMSFHLFGGIGFRLLILDTTIGASYDVSNGNFGASLSVRLQL